ncbi:ABC transporter [Cryobacterium sp.]|uniref:ABC transporter n=1 Tax=Cryobacterium sp. TaxID=1926290 RepID=UPI002635CF81|nr:ABC transporter [Cryobacterium sp.]MCU1445761.1 transporter [Cryobacterium sp.]
MNSPKSHFPRPAFAALAATGALLAGCAGPAANPSASPDATDDAVPHGYVEGATEAAEPQLHLATVNPTGEVAVLDLQGGATETIATVDGVSSVATDGRYLFASAADTGTVTIVDTGVWTVDHDDHQHYYRGTPGVAGTVTDAGPGAVSGGGSLTTVRFADSGTGVILNHGALGDGIVTELGRVSGEPGAGLLVPFGDRVITTSTGNGASALQVLDATGDVVAGEAIECLDPAGTITTRVGVVFGCADGAVLATAAGLPAPDVQVEFERIPYPAGIATTDRAMSFDNRAGRPTVAAVAGDRGAWLLDTRERTWTLLSTDTALAQVAAVDDPDQNVVALTRDGRVLVFDAESGATTAATEPLLAATLADGAPGGGSGSALPDGVTLTVDTNRAYLNAPAEGEVYEIDFADSARLARTFPIDGRPRFLVETGR